MRWKTRMLAALPAAASLMISAANGSAGTVTREAPVSQDMPARLPSLQGASVFVYSFLGVYLDDFGEETLDLFGEQLPAALAKEGVKPRFARFDSSWVAYAFPVTEAGTTSDGIFVRAHRSYQVPYGEAIATKAADEAAAGAQYRLIVFPAGFSDDAGVNSYEIRWDLIDIRSGARLWTYTYKGSHLVGLVWGQNSKGRANKFVKAGLAEMRKAGLFSKKPG
jgi:hypothetical protein